MPEFFLERSLGKLTGDRLRDAGWSLQRIHDHFPADAADVADEEWISYGIERGWVCLTKDKKIRYRSQELAALTRGHVFCLSDGNVSIEAAVGRLQAARPAIERAVARETIGFWFVYADGKVTRKWP